MQQHANYTPRCVRLDLQGARTHFGILTRLLLMASTHLSACAYRLTAVAGRRDVKKAIVDLETSGSDMPVKFPS
jgi:hypothetical protein